MAVDATAVARVVGIQAEFLDLRGGAAAFLPQHIAIVAQGASAATYPLTPFRITSAFQAGSRYGFGSPIHLIALQLFPPTGDGVGTIPVTVFPLVDDYDAGVPAVGSITPSATATVQATFRARIGGVLSAPFTVAVGDTVGVICDKMVVAINAVLEMPVTAVDGTTDVDLTAKWDGASGNDIVLEVLTEDGDVPSEDVTFSFTAMASGAVDPDIDAALEAFGSIWYTLVISGFKSTNTAALDSFSAAGEGRWNQLVRKPFMAFSGTAEDDVNTAVTVPNARTLDRVNVQCVAPGSPNMPCVIAAAAVREIAKLANNNPPTDYGSRPLRGLTPGLDTEQWNYTQRDLAVKAGSSTVEVKGGLVHLSDTVTFYHPAGDPTPAFRFVVDVIKLWNVIYNLGLEFENPRWDGAPLIPDGQPTVNPNARTPKAAKAAVCAIIDGLALQAILSNPEAAKEATSATINSSNPKRLDIRTVVQLSGNTNIISTDLLFGFFFGTPPLAA